MKPTDINKLDEAYHELREDILDAAQPQPVQVVVTIDANSVWDMDFTMKKVKEAIWERVLSGRRILLSMEPSYSERGKSMVDVIVTLKPKED